MEYLNAADVLPKKLLKELSTYVNGQLLYVPSTESKKLWGSKSGSRQYYEQRNNNIVEMYQKDISIDELCEQFNLSYDTIRKIIKDNL
jgi:Mor family transcriptional regulator